MPERRPGTVPFDHTDPLLAAAAWSALVEPADVVAGALVANRGAAAALDLLLDWDRAGRSDFEKAGATAQGDALLSRCRPRLAGLDPRRDLDRLASLGGRPVLPGDADWPAGLDALGAGRPFLLWVRGRLPGPGARAAAVVGSRASTSYGDHVAAEFAVELARGGHPVISGGAFGIDVAAHRACLAVGGHTVAVLAGGVDRLYPRAHEDLLARIAAEGALVAEVPPGAEPRRHRFLTRNRLIAALAAGTVVVEAGLRSGALRTAREAIALKRPLGAVPGPVTSPTSAGCHDLLREGMAVCVTTGAQARELVAPVGAGAPGSGAGRTYGASGMHDGTAPPPPVPRGAVVQPGLLDGLDEAGSRVLDAMPLRAARDADQIAAAAGLALADVRSALGALELGGRVQRVDGRWRRAPRD